MLAALTTLVVNNNQPFAIATSPAVRDSFGLLLEQPEAIMAKAFTSIRTLGRSVDARLNSEELTEKDVVRKMLLRLPFCCLAFSHDLATDRSNATVQAVTVHVIMDGIMYEFIASHKPTDEVDHRHDTTDAAVGNVLADWIAGDPRRTISNSFLGGTVDGAEVDAFKKLGTVQDSCCAAHRGQSVVQHVLGDGPNPSATARIVQGHLKAVSDLNKVFRKSPQSTRLLKDAQLGKIDAATGKSVVPVACKGVAGIRWTGEVSMLERQIRLLPFEALLDIGGTTKDKQEYRAKLNAAQDAMLPLKYLVAILHHLNLWTVVLQSRSLPTYSLVLRFIKDMKACCDDVANWADQEGDTDGEQFSSLLLAEFEECFKDWEKNKLMKLAQLLDPRNNDLLGDSSPEDATELLTWGFKYLLPRIKSTGIPAGGGGGGVGGSAAGSGAGGGGGGMPKAGSVESGAKPAPVSAAASAAKPVAAGDGKGAASKRGRDGEAAGGGEAAAAAATAAASVLPAPAKRGKFGVSVMPVAAVAADFQTFLVQAAMFVELLNDPDDKLKDVNPLKFYVEQRDRMPDIKLMSDAAFALQATSSLSEGTFSQSHRTVTPERSSLQGARAGRLVRAMMRFKISRVRNAKERDGRGGLRGVVGVEGVVRVVAMDADPVSVNTVHYGTTSARSTPMLRAPCIRHRAHKHAKPPPPLPNAARDAYPADHNDLEPQRVQGIAPSVGAAD